MFPASFYSCSVSYCLFGREKLQDTYTQVIIIVCGVWGTILIFFVACSALLFVLWALPGSEFYELFVLGFSCFFHLFFCFLFLFFYLNFFLLDGSPSIAWESRFK